MRLPEYNKLEVLESDPDTRREALKQLEYALWDRGNLRHMCLPNAQTWMYDRVQEQPGRFQGQAEPMVFMCHRRLGKSHMSALLCIERCLRQPGAQVWFCTDTTEHARDFLEGMLVDAFSCMPPWISFRTRRNRYYFRNKKWPRGVESMLTMKGLDYQKGGGVRGGAADLVIVDEAREVKHLEYVLKRVVVPMFRGRPDPMLILLSTPADTLDHDFHRVYVKKARSNDSFMCIPASKNPDWTSDDERLMLGEYGSKEDIGWKREIECMEIPDDSEIIIPEWGGESDIEGATKARPFCFHEELPKPPYYKGYVVCDMGWKDHTGMLFARHDFYNNKLQIIDEIFENYKDTQTLVDLMLEKIEKNFPEPEVRADLTIKADTNALNLADFNRLLYNHGYYVLEVSKYDRDGALNRLRSGIQQHQIQVAETCLELDYQLMNGIWNKSRKNFERTKKLGHCDLIDCLIYLYRECRWMENPYPNEQKVGVVGGKFYSPYSRNHARGDYDADTMECLRGIAGKPIRTR